MVVNANNKQTKQIDNMYIYNDIAVNNTTFQNTWVYIADS